MGFRLRWPWQRASEAAMAAASGLDGALAALRGEWDAEGVVVAPAFSASALRTHRLFPTTHALPHRTA